MISEVTWLSYDDDDVDDDDMYVDIHDDGMQMLHSQQAPLPWHILFDVPTSAKLSKSNSSYCETAGLDFSDSNTSCTNNEMRGAE